MASIVYFHKYKLKYAKKGIKWVSVGEIHIL